MASLRKYATIEEVEAYANVTSTDDDEFQERINLAEELIDQYVGTQQKAMREVRFGVVSAISANHLTIFDTSDRTQLMRNNDFYKNCVIEIVGGTGLGQQAFIASSSYDNKSLTISEVFPITPDTTSVFKIYQLAKFPRWKDVVPDPVHGTTYYKTIPNAVHRATMAQVQFMLAKGDDYFLGDDSDKESERILNYSYSRGAGAASSAIIKLLSPKARILLRGIKNSTGKLIVE
jgi:hypothetical protein